MKNKLTRLLGPLIGLLLFAGALWVLHHTLTNYHFADVIRSLREIPRDRLLLALLLSMLSYLVLTGYDRLAFRYIRHPLPYRKIALTSFIGYAFSHNLGYSVLSGGSVRYRLYSAWGLSAVEIAQAFAFCLLTFWLGLLAVGGVVFAIRPMAIPALLHLPALSVRLIGILFLVLLAAYLLSSVLVRRPLKIKGREFALPSLRHSLLQITLAAIDWALVGGLLYVLLPPSSALSYFSFLGIFILAQSAGLVSQVPGGLGVFETVIILLLSPTYPASSVLGALLAYRAIYYFLPLGIAAVLFGAHEIFERKTGVKWIAGLFGR